MGEIRELYSRLEKKRHRALQDAEAAEEFMLRMGLVAPDESRGTHTSVLRRGTATLVSILDQALLPPNIQWYRMAPGFLGEVGQETRQLFDQAEGIVHRYLGQTLFTARANMAMRHCIGAACCLMHFLPERIRVIPLSRFVINRIDGVVHNVVFESDVAKKEPDPKKPDETVKLYTSIDYKNGTVRQEREDVEEVKVVDWKPEQFVLAEADEPEEDGYPTSPVWYILPDVHSCDVFERALSEIAELASKVFWFLDESQAPGLTPKKVQKADNGTIFSGTADALTAVTAGVKIGDWSLVTQEKTAKEKIIGEVMGSGIAQQALAAKSATAAIIVARAIDAQFHGLASRLAETLLKGAVRAAGSVTGVLPESHLDEAAMRKSGVEASLLQRARAALAVQVHIVTGVDAFSREAEAEQTMELVDRFRQSFPEVATRIDGAALFEEVMAARRLNIDSFWRPAAPGGSQPGAVSETQPAGAPAVNV